MLITSLFWILVSETIAATQEFPCNEDFFRDQDSDSCVPNCHTWSEFSREVRIATDVLTGLAAAIGAVSGLAVIVISVVRSKQM